MRSKTVVLFRAAIMLACTIALPLVALFGTSLPTQLKSWYNGGEVARLPGLSPPDVLLDGKSAPATHERSALATSAPHANHAHGASTAAPPLSTLATAGLPNGVTGGPPTNGSPNSPTNWGTSGAAMNSLPSSTYADAQPLSAPSPNLDPVGGNAAADNFNANPAFGSNASAGPSNPPSNAMPLSNSPTSNTPAAFTPPNGYGAPPSVGQMPTAFNQPAPSGVVRPPIAKSSRVSRHPARPRCPAPSPA